MEIYRYSADNQLGYIRVEVDDNYQLQAGELKELPTPCYTPMKLVNGVLTSATLDESNQAAQDYLDKAGIKEALTNNTTEIQLKAFQTQIAAMNTQVNTLTAQNAALQKMITVQNTQIAAMKGSANNA